VILTDISAFRSSRPEHSFSRAWSTIPAERQAAPDGGYTYCSLSRIVSAPDTGARYPDR
jgi:hypothetical protein